MCINFKSMRGIGFELSLEKLKQITLKAVKYFGLCHIIEASYQSENPRGMQVSCGFIKYM